MRPSTPGGNPAWNAHLGSTELTRFDDAPHDLFGVEKSPARSDASARMRTFSSDALAHTLVKFTLRLTT